jgi:hypothetical protein
MEIDDPRRWNFSSPFVIWGLAVPNTYSCFLYAFSDSIAAMMINQSYDSLIIGEVQLPRVMHLFIILQHPNRPLERTTVTFRGPL